MAECQIGGSWHALGGAMGGLGKSRAAGKPAVRPRIPPETAVGMPKQSARGVLPMSFGYECEMVRPAEEWLGSQGLATKKEFPTPWGICDLVGCSLNADHVQKRLSFGQRRLIGSQLACVLLSRIPDIETGRSASLRRLSSSLAEMCDEGEVAAEVDRLLGRRFVRRTPRGHLQKLNGWMLLHQRLVALELKLTRIDDALHQAICHLTFADQSYVGLPIDRAICLANSQRAAAFVREGIGLVAVGRNSCTTLIEPSPRRNYQSAALQMMCAERFWTAHLQAIKH